MMRRKLVTTSKRLFSTSREADFNYCVSLVRSKDYESFIYGLFIPETMKTGNKKVSASKEAYYAVRAFNVELASVLQESQSNNFEMMQMKLQFWRDSLDSIYSNKQALGQHGGTPVLRSLSRAVKEVNLTRRFLERLIDAREFDLEHSAVQQDSFTLKQEQHQQQQVLTTSSSRIVYPSLADMELHAEYTSSSLLYLSLESSRGGSGGEVFDDYAEAVASHVGRAVGLSNLLRGVAHRAVHLNEVCIPLDLLQKHNISPETLTTYQSYSSTISDNSQSQNQSHEALREAVGDIVQKALEDIMKARELQHHLKTGAKPSFLPAVGSSIFLQNLQSKGYNIFHLDLHSNVKTKGNFWLLMNIGKAWLTGRF